MNRYEEIKNLNMEDMAKRLFDVYIKGYLDGATNKKNVTIQDIIDELKGEI